MEIAHGTLLNGRYRVLDKIDTGTRADIRFATDELLGRRVTVKIIQRLLALTFYEPEKLIMREANMAARLQHPNVIPIYDFGKHEDAHYLVMAEFTHSLNLYQEEQTERFSIYQIIEILRGVASALDFIHEQGVVHQNLKPQNILLTARPSQQIFPYISDFGVAALKMSEAGTPRLMAPEQLTGLYEVTGATDRYAFGIMAYEILTGQKTFNAQTSLAMLQINSQTLTKESDGLEYFDGLPSVREFRPELSQGFDVVLNRLTRYEPSERYQTATQAIIDLNKAIYSGHSNIEGKIFISYSTRDKDYVHKFAAELLSIGVDVWIDLNIHQGSDWGDSIEDALKACDMLLLIVTDASMDSAYVNHEWSYFMGLGKPVYPFVPDTKLPKNIHPRLNRLQLVQGTGDMLVDIQNVVTVLAGGNPKQLGGLEE